MIGRRPVMREVLVVGAGPVGLALALGLARRGREVLVLEKEEGTAETSRAPAIWPATQEILAGLGVVDEFLEEGIVVPRLRLHDADRDRVLLEVPLEDLEDETPFPHLLILPQSRTESLLLAALEREPKAEVRFSSEVTALALRPREVELRVGEGDGSSTVAARLVVGCDGAHSQVRESIGGTLQGLTYDMRAALADVRLDTPDAGLPFPRLTTRPRLAVGIRMGSGSDVGLWRLILPFFAADDVSLDRRVREAASSLFGDRPWQPVWRSEFRLHRRVSSTFAGGRVVLAGDAAHLNSPVGGQGMNVGIEDASLLVEVLERALDQDDPEPLATYASERSDEIRRGVNRFTDFLTRGLLLGRGRLVRPTLTLVNTAMRIPPVRHRVARRLAMLSSRQTRTMNETLPEAKGK